MDDLYGTISNLSPKSLTLIAIIIGFLLMDDLTADKQIALGNLFILVGQVIVTDGTELRVIEAEREHQQLNSTIADIEDRIAALEAKEIK